MLVSRCLNTNQPPSEIPDRSQNPRDVSAFSDTAFSKEKKQVSANKKAGWHKTPLASTADSPESQQNLSGARDA